jgi:hypothetical protein
MDKGIQGWQNVQLLKWSAELGLRLSWSLLWGFPGEKDDWYQDMAGWLPALEHLQPPATTPRVRFDRYSVYHEQAQRLGLILFPIGAMSLVYPVPDADLHGLSYFFATEPGVGPLRYLRDLAAQQERSPGIGALVGAARAWRAAHATGHATGRRPVLRAQDDGRELTVTDSRGCARAPRQVLTGLDRAVLLACDAAPRRAKLAEVLAAPPDQVADAVARLAADHLVLEIDGRLVGLALVGLPPGGPVPRYPDHTEFPGGHVFVDRPR